MAARTNLLLSPSYFITTAKIAMLSPNSHGCIWNAQANRYAHRESVVLKRLHNTVINSNPIECMIRAININQDSRIIRLSMPSSTSQLQLIQTTYTHAGLDTQNLQDHYQYFKAYRTETKAKNS
ncbi:hypothetical protein BGW36DRAFT_360109 [Talaromyces proteolyticus]|uniref:Uncharacterized protein n=1 Tax=Talaromyces proteolyticus TaxID=1131652 RepID=A0AAD4KQT5_9EURO|nr:uncharacterized protein BGW36DRAFT_360109 [Talaromyces proteolyticus]KAH8696257.1 hypothetical protein BGW36DRAFT_360109 [Talaromyces proteolyticus]